MMRGRARAKLSPTPLPHMLTHRLRTGGGSLWRGASGHALPFPVPHFPSPPLAFVWWSSETPPHCPGKTKVLGWGLCPLHPAGRVEGARGGESRGWRETGVEGARGAVEGAGGGGSSGPSGKGGRLTSNSPAHPHPHIHPGGPRDAGGRGAGLEDRTSSWQDTGRQAGGSSPRQGHRGKRSVGPGAYTSKMDQPPAGLSD